MRRKASPAQGNLNLHIDRLEEGQDGIGMGVLSDGTAFLTQRGLAVLCGVMNAHIGTIGTEWNEMTQKPRISTIKDLLKGRGKPVRMPYIPLRLGARVVYAYPEHVCMAILEYYAFAAGPNRQPEALDNFRRIAGRGLHAFIYEKLGYRLTPQEVLWQQFHDRVSLVFDNVPAGYFSVFKEIADLFVTLIKHGVPIGKDFVPDISVGKHWATYWKEQGFTAKYGERILYRHDYPDYFPQAASNPQTPYCYPEAALGAFRKWMREVYLQNKFPAYLTSKGKSGLMPPSTAEQALQAIQTRNPAPAIPPR
ncbi:MAG: hypothetical protein K2Y27_00150 [Xanthobacteraceae bacterium]|nr:hypothetical protein [Xanthobacteraceae bacterium]